MSIINEHPIFFRTSAQFRSWLEKNHATCSQQWIGFYRKNSGRPSMSWPEAVDESLCFGWIDGLRKSIDADSYKIRFTPRRSNSNWSEINIRRMQQLMREGKVRPAGAEAFAQRSARKSGIYSYENRGSALLSRAAEREFKSHPAAWQWFVAQTPSYRQTAIWWVVSAKRPETRKRRLATLIADSAAKRKIGPLRAPGGVS